MKADERELGLNDWKNLACVTRDKSVVSPEDPVMTLYINITQNIKKKHNHG